MSDQTNPPVNPRHPGAAGGPQPGQYPTPQQPPQQSPYGGAQQRPGQYGGPQGGQPQYGPQGGQPQRPQGGQPPYGPQGGQPQYGPQGGQPQAPQYGQPQPPQYGQPGGQQYGQPGPAQYGQGGQPPFGPQYGQAQQWQPEPKKKRGKLIPLVAIVAVLAVISGGAVFAYARLNGGGDQPAAVLPGTAIAYARIDLNPSAGQKVAAIRFMLKFPSAKENLGLTSDNDDLRQKLFDLIKKQSGDDLADVDFAKDIEPWLGDRAGAAAIPAADGDEDPDAIVAVQVKDQEKATAGLDKLFAEEKDKPGRAFTEGYVILGENQASVDAAVSAAKNSPLSENSKFEADMSALGEQGFASVWADTKGLAELSGRSLTDEQRSALPAGSMAAALRFDASFVELKGVVHADQSVKVSSSDAGDLIAQLPDTTAGALALSDGENLVSTIWSQLEKNAGGLDLKELTANFADEYGLAIPDDVKPLLGKNFAVAIDKDDSDGPKIAARMETDVAKAEGVVDKVTSLLRDRSSANVPIVKAKDDDTLVVATDQGYADQVLKGGNLGDTENFKQAIPDSKNAVMVGYVDFEAAAGLSEDFSSDKDAAALRSAGYTIRVTGDGEADFTVRVVAK